MQVESVTKTDPIPLALMRDHLRVYHTADDANIRSALDAALDAWDTESLRPVRDTQFSQEFEEVPTNYAFQSGPVTSIDSVIWYDKDTQAATTVSADNYRIAYTGAWPKLQFLYDFASDNSAAGWWKVTWSTSWPTPSDDVLRAIMMLAATFYDERDQLSPVQLRANAVGWAAIVNRWRWPAT
jgi:uncharacterized phiE125 gp8 family phage protein